MKILIENRGAYKLPNRAHANDCGADVYAPFNVDIAPHDTIKIDLKFAIHIPDGFGGFIIPRSGLSAKGIVTQIPPVDPGYTGNVHAITTNLTDDWYHIEKGDRIGQLVVLPTVICDFVEELGQSRQDGGFGSTGV